MHRLVRIETEKIKRQCEPMTRCEIDNLADTDYPPVCIRRLNGLILIIYPLYSNKDKYGPCELHIGGLSLKQKWFLSEVKALLSDANALVIYIVRFFSRKMVI